jgi:membrane protein
MACHYFLRREIIEGTIYKQIEGFVGLGAAKSIQEAMRSTMHSDSSKLATIIGFSSLIIGATAVFGEIQDSINLIWKLKSKPKKGPRLVTINN